MRGIAAAPVPGGRVMADMARGTVMVGDVRLDPLDDDLVTAMADDDRLVSIDPDKRMGDRHASLL